MNIAPDKTADAILWVLGHVDPPENLCSVTGSRLYDGGGVSVSALDEDSFLITANSKDPVNGARHVTMMHVSFNVEGTYRSSVFTGDVAFCQQRPHRGRDSG